MTAKRNIIPVFVPHLGCKSDCVFCNQRKISGSLSPVRAADIENIITLALEKIPEKTNIHLAFYGGSFTAIPVGEQNELLSAALPFLRDGRLCSVRLSTRPDAIDEKTLERLKGFGVRTLEIGAQSMCDAVLLASGRGHTAAQTEKAAQLVKAYGFELILQMMTGLPGDTKARTLETAEKLIALRPDGVRIYPAVIIADTPLQELWQSGKYAEHTVTQAVDYCAAIVPLFEKAGIDIIRLGLNPTEALSQGAAVGGAYHPALGELVRARIMLDKAKALLEGIEPKSAVTLQVNFRDVSAMTGPHRSNLEALKAEFLLESVKVQQAELEKGTVILR